MSKEDYTNGKFELDERQMRELLAEDPVPELTQLEMDTLTQRVLARIPKRRQLRWFDIRPAFQFGLAAAALLVLVMSVVTLQIPTTEIHYYKTEIYESVDAEDMLMEAIVTGEVAEDEVIVEFLALDKETADEIYEVYLPEDYDEHIDMLTEEEAEAVLQIMDELGYPSEEEA